MNEEARRQIEICLAKKYLALLVVRIINPPWPSDGYFEWRSIILLSKLIVLGLIEENILSLSWKKPKNYTSFNIKIGKQKVNVEISFLLKPLIDRCDAKVDCYRIYDEQHHNSSSYEISNEVFTRCTTFNIHLEAVNSQQHKIRDEISIANR